MKKSLDKDLLILLDSIKSSEVVENRIQLLQELGKIELHENSAVKSVIESLITLWEEFTCLDISQCTLHKTILQVATKFLGSDISGCLIQFLVLGIKANIWCRKHLQMTLMSTQDSPEEEHSSFFYQLVLDLFCYSTATYTALIKNLVLTNKELMVSLENFISEHLTLTKDLVSEIKIIHTSSPDLLKKTLESLDAVARLCRVYCNGVEWDIYNAKSETDKGNSKEAEHGDLVLVVTNCTIEKLCELGIIAANVGGSLVGLLNTSWKSVVSLLQLGKGALAEKVNIAGVIITLTSLASASLRCAAETWSSPMIEKVSEAEAKSIFLPIKFLLINAIRIISQYQTQALSVYKEISLCVIMISSFRISLSKMEHLNSTSDVLADILEPTSLLLLNSLLNSAQVKKEHKFQILDWLFSNERDMVSAADVSRTNENLGSLDAMFSDSTETMCKEKIFNLGRVSLLLHLLKGAPDLEDDVRLGIARKLGWLFDKLVEEDVYSSILVLKIPMRQGSGNQEPNHQPMFCVVLHALKTFMITVSSSLAWNEIESFLIENLFHPHFLCWEIITELWCFLLRHADTDMVNDVIDKICSLLRSTSSESALFPDSALRRVARLICILVNYGPKLMADRVYSLVLDCNAFQCPSSVYTALLMEGFPLNFLSEKYRSIAKERVVTQYFDFLETFEEKSQGQSNSSVYGAPVFALCASLQSLQVSLSDSNMKTLKFLISVIHKYKMSTHTAIKDNYRTLLGELLGIISNLKHLYSSDEMEEVILELQKLFISNPALSDSQLYLCKPNLANFMAGLGHVELPDSKDTARSLAAWEELYPMLLRERHWAFVHLAITAFGYFAARTSCNELWRFVPQDAALSYDLESGKEADEDRFMLELKVFLEKERACSISQANLDQLEVLVKEGKILKEIVQNNIKINLESIKCDMMEIDDEKQPNKKRKFPDGICKGVELLQSGLKTMVDGLSQWQPNRYGSTEVHKKFLTHFSRLEDVIAHLVSLADNE